nr:hypothetical protein [uncultured Methanocorpusculum sp.]
MSSLCKKYGRIKRIFHPTPDLPRSNYSKNSIRKGKIPIDNPIFE